MLNSSMRQRDREDEQGFTLIELLVVVVIIGVLVAIAIPLYLNYRKGAQNRSAQADVRNAVSTVEACIGDNAGKAPGAGGTDVVADGTASKKVINLTCTSAGLTTAASATAAASAPTPAAGNQTINVSDGVTLTYTPDTSNAKYTIVGKYTGGATYTYTSADGKTRTT